MQRVKTKKVTIKATIITVFVFIGVYLITYILNSIFGGYWLKPVSGGKYTYTSGLSTASAILWQPYYGHLSPNETSTLGWFYCPLISLDRRWWHTNKDIFEDEIEIYSEDSRLKIHPKFVKESVSTNDTN
jgi:hypothetical protein